MKMPDGGFRPACNIELATDSANGIIVGVGVTSSGTDAGQAAPMEEQLFRRTGRRPDSYLMDGGFATREDHCSGATRGECLCAGEVAQEQAREGALQSPIRRRAGRCGGVNGWLEAKAIYRQRASVAEWTNAQVRHHGVRQFSVRGLAKVTSVMLLVAVAHNFLRWEALMG